MNTGVGDATDLSWKLAATLAGWGGPALLDSYERERRQIGLRNVRASGAAMDGRTTWRAATSREAMGIAFDAEQRKVTEILGIEAGYRYVDSPVVCERERRRARSRQPRVRADDVARVSACRTSGSKTVRPCTTGWGSAIRCCCSAGRRPIPARSNANFARPARRSTCVRVPDARAREIYERDLVLVRPDLHVAWRGNAPPADPSAVAAIVTGRVPSGRTVGV